VPEPAPAAALRHAPAAPAPASDSWPLDRERIVTLWPDLIRKLGVRLGVPLSRVEPDALAISGPNLLVIRVSPGYNWVAEECETPEARARIETELSKLLDRSVTVRFERSGDVGSTGADVLVPGTPGPPASPPRRPGNLDSDPMVQKVVQLFEARPVHLEVEEEREAPG